MRQRAPCRWVIISEMAMGEPLYNRIGCTYSTTRREDPRIADALRAALGDARTVLNVGAGSGAYEPADRDVIALEPSSVMIAQRPADGAPVIQGSAESIPLDDDSVDAAMAVISDHHWTNRSAGLREMRRVARDRVVILNSDPSLADAFWLTRDYLPGFLSLIPPPPPTCGTLESGDRLGSALAALGDFAASAATSLPGVCLLDVRRDRAPAQPSVTRGA
jgi:SAM-dependent methyltransferase